LLSALYTDPAVLARLHRRISFKKADPTVDHFAIPQMTRFQNDRICSRRFPFNSIHRRTPIRKKVMLEGITFSL